jgi:hypothetical protein
VTATSDVPARWYRPPGLDREVGALIVGVGASDLDVRSAGMHHLVEHLVMRRVGELPFETNASSGTEVVVFHATGTRDQVLGFLRAIAAAIRSVHRGPSPAALAQEQWVLLTEQARRTVGWAGPWTARFGCAGPGLTELPEIGAARASVEDVQAFAGRWFVAQNARVALSFDPAGPLDVELPDGPAHAPQAWRAGARSTRPVLCETETGAVTLSIDGERVPGDLLVLQVLLRALMDDLRHEHALVYSVEAVTCATGPGRRALLAALDPLGEAVGPTVDRVLSVLGGLSTTGPDERVLEDVRTLVLAQLSDPAGLFDRFVGEVGDELRGEEPVSIERSRGAVAQMSTESVRDRLAELLTTLVLTVPAGAGLDDGTLSRVAGAGFGRRDLIATDRRPASQVRHELLSRTPSTGPGSPRLPMRPTRGYAPRVFGPLRGVQLWIGPGQFTLIPTDGPAVRVAAADVVLTETGPDGMITLLTRRGGWIAVNPRHFRGATRWWKHFWDRLDADVLHLPELDAR